MSWMKRRGQPSPNPGNPGVQTYPQQHSIPQQQWPQQQNPSQYPNNDWYNQNMKHEPAEQKTPYWHQPPTQEAYTAPPNQYQYNQYSAPPNNYYQNPAYAQQSQPQYFVQQGASNTTSTAAEAYPQTVKQEDTDPWNWDWGDSNFNTSTASHVQPPVQNQNAITESFANDESWNWTVDDSNSKQAPPKPEVKSDDNRLTESNLLQISPEQSSLPSVRRIKEEPLTPQWSIESQVSQDSSDDILTSESDNRNNILSRSSTISHSPSIPASTHDANDYPLSPKEEPLNSEYCEGEMDNVDRALHKLSLGTFENKEILTPSVNAATPPKKSSPPLMPPPQGNVESSGNPYKRNIAPNHKSANSMRKEAFSQEQDNFMQSSASAFAPLAPRTSDSGANLETPPDNSERPDQLPDNIQKAVRKTSTVQQQWPENCEIAPINDRNQYLETGQLSDDNYNQLENTQSSTDLNDSLPPPGLRRLVLGQMEQSEANQPNFDNSLDEPPPGLSRMVLGRTETTQPTMFTPNHVEYGNTEEPPAGLHRMIPGESSSPESSSYARYVNDTPVYQAANFDDMDNYVSESELNQMGVTLVAQRSATIGADTPPASHQQPTSTGYSSSSSEAVISRVGAVGIDNESREPDVEGANTLDTNIPIIPDNNRREDIDGGPQDEVKLTRDQTVGQNPTDHSSGSASGQEKRKPRNYQTDSDHEQPKDRHRPGSPTKYDKDWKYREYDRPRQMDRESPERYRDRKYEWRRNKDRGYEEDTDYYSDKERERRHRDDREEYERRYNSLRKDYDRDKKRDKDRREYSRDERHDEYYYGRYKEDYYGPNRSRPSSRSDSVHDSYRERRTHDREHERVRHRDRNPDRERDRDHRRPRDPYNQYYQGFNYDPYSPYYQQYQYQYYENLRRTNPQAYAEWYRKYYQSQAQAATTQLGYSTEDRASVHSGRSSANEELNKDRYTRQSYYANQSFPYYYRDVPNASTIYTADDSRLLDQTDSSMNLEDANAALQRLTPAKFSTAHVKVSISSGQYIKVLPNYPIDGQPASLEILNVQNLLHDNEDLKELSEFPGPLMKGVTHKKTVIDYCEQKIKRVLSNTNVQDVESYVLMWELLILLLRQNGMVVGTDIAELLMKNRTAESSRRPSIASSCSAHLDAEHVEQVNRSSPGIQYKEEYITDKFREFLIYGSGKEALEWAMKHGLWGHALFLASKLDKRTYANVMMRFANGLTMNDPLQTLYQLLSGRQPAAVTCVADDKWGDWRPHLAMILSNTSQRPDLDRKAILTLGDTLSSRGSLYAAHFCYLMAQLEFGRYGSHDTKLVLLGSSQQKPFKAFANNEAIFMTEIYEYACSLNDSGFVIPEFQPYKYLLATRLVDYGLLEKALLYLECAAIGIKQNPSRIQSSLVNNLCELAERLKYYDPMHAAEDEDLDHNRTESTWLTDLKVLLNNLNMGLITHESTTNLTNIEGELSEEKSGYDQQQEQWQQQSMEYYQQSTQQSWQSEQQTTEYTQPTSYDEGNQQKAYESTNYQEQYWNQNQQQQYWEDNTENKQATEEQSTEYWNSAQNEQSAEPINEPKPDEPPQPVITMPNQSKSKNMYDDIEETAPKPTSPAKPKPAASQTKPASTGWFGGIWSKLAPKPRNQMKLPDDKNPTIVWDPEKKRWVNLEADGDEVSNEIKPPPKMSDMFPSKTLPPPMPMSVPVPTLPNINQNIPPIENVMPMPNSVGSAMVEQTETVEDHSKPAQPNMFKLQRGRNLKKAYVDVFNPNGTKQVASVAAPEMFGALPPGGPQMNYFVPAPVSDPSAPTDFLTPNAGPEDPQGNAPAMYNPSAYSSNGRNAK